MKPRVDAASLQCDSALAYDGRHTAARINGKLVTDNKGRSVCHWCRRPIARKSAMSARWHTVIESREAIPQ